MTYFSLGTSNSQNINWENHQINNRSGYNTAAAKKLVSLTEEYGLFQHVNQATRMDLVFTIKPDLIKRLYITDGLSDHNRAPKLKRRPKRTIFIRSKADQTGIQHALNSFLKEYISFALDTSVDDKWNMIATKITEIMNKIVPTRMTSSRHNLP